MIKIQKKNFSLSEVNKKLLKKNSGAIVTFIGIVRGEKKTKKIQSIYIECYLKMAEKELKKVEMIANKKWKLNNCIIIHRYGKIRPEEKIVYVATSAEHRKNAFKACEFIIDYLKTKAPFWKIEKINSKEIYVQSKKKDEKKIKKWGSII
ncbi:MAG: Molybdopterin synthase catalytic subunit [Alphaproteobacteria bacterium MarineAlpha6_Bin1]|nr:MAG: Molybdopterin synthase catalytic subunit [Alphaproteobacteria bacterium MarineAlpha6_Bin1]